SLLESVMELAPLFIECDNMNRYERPDRNIRQQKAEGLWKRTPQRWNTQDHYHLSPTEHYSHIRNDLNRGCNYVDSPPVSHLEGYEASGFYPPLRSLPANTVLLDEMTLRHMVQDCTAVKTQLLKMKRILHQTDELLSEITRLKDDLKKKDETIQELERRLVSNHAAHENECDHHNGRKWLCTSPQVLQPSSHLPRSADFSQGKLAKASSTVARSEPPPQDQPVGHEDDNAALDSGTDSGCKPSTLNTQRNEDSSLVNAHSIKNEAVREKAKDVASRKSKALQPLGPSAQLNAQDGQAKLALKSHSSRPNQALPPKMSRALRAPKQTVPVPPPPPPPATSSRDSLVPPLSVQVQPLSASNVSLPSSRSQRASKLRPPAISFRPKPRTIPQTIVAPEQQRFQASTSKPLIPAKDAPQNRDPALRPGEGLTYRHSRLPKPKT
uniref:Uncharacterized protein n=1 Tax=Laticauda laticaudata TaxID=8630 RepID=A0A8C5SBP7_LATLA